MIIVQEEDDSMNNQSISKTQNLQYKRKNKKPPIGPPEGNNISILGNCANLLGSSSNGLPNSDL